MAASQLPRNITAFGPILDDRKPCEFCSAGAPDPQGWRPPDWTLAESGASMQADWRPGPTCMDGELTGLLQAVQSGDRAALDRAFHVVYAELKGLAHAQRVRVANDTLSTTGLVHETYLKFSGASEVSARDREHFFSLAARAMRQVLLDRARIAGAQKRPSDHARLTLDERLPVGDAEIDAVSADLLDLDRALTGLGALDARLAEVAEMHLFAGLEFGEIADIRAVSERTVLRDWRKARAILAAALADAA